MLSFLIYNIRCWQRLWLATGCCAKPGLFPWPLNVQYAAGHCHNHIHNTVGLAITTTVLLHWLCRRPLKKFPAYNGPAVCWVAGHYEILVHTTAAGHNHFIKVIGLFIPQYWAGHRLSIWPNVHFMHSIPVANAFYPASKCLAVTISYYFESGHHFKFPSFLLSGRPLWNFEHITAGH